MKNKYFIKLVSLMLSLIMIAAALSACKEDKPAKVDLSAYLTQVDNNAESKGIGYSNYIKQFKDDKSSVSKEELKRPLCVI